MTKISFFCALISFCCMSCYYDNEEELYPATTCNAENISYNSDVLPILNSKCLTCHNTVSAPSIGNNINMEGYNNLKVYINNNKFIGAIRHSNGFSPMPKGSSKLPACEILKIESWVNAGSPEN